MDANYQLHPKTIVSIDSISVYTDKLNGMPASILGAKDTVMNRISWNLCSFSKLKNETRVHYITF